MGINMSWLDHANVILVERTRKTTLSVSEGGCCPNEGMPFFDRPESTRLLIFGAAFSFGSRSSLTWNNSSRILKPIVLSVWASWFKTLGNLCLKSSKFFRDYGTRIVSPLSSVKASVVEASVIEAPAVESFHFRNKNLQFSSTNLWSVVVDWEQHQGFICFSRHDPSLLFLPTRCW